MSSILSRTRFKTLDYVPAKNYDETEVPQIKEETNFQKKEGLPEKVVEKLEKIDLIDDGDTETSLKYNFSQNFSRKKTIKSIFFVLLDTLLAGVYFTLLGYLFAWLINNYLTSPLELKKEDGTYDPSQSRARVFSELILECLSLIVAIYISVQVGLRLPYILKKSPLFHRDYRIFSGGIILVYTLMSLQERMVEKSNYVFNSAKSDRTENTIQIIDCAKNVTSGISSWEEFRECISNIN